MKRYSIALAIAVLIAFAAPVLANPFADLPFSHWAYDAVKKLTDRGIMTGMPDGTFKGEKKVSRYELAAVLARALDAVGTRRGGIDAADLKTLEKLIIEFADELALLGVKVTALEDELRMVRDDVAAIKGGSGASGCGCAGGAGGVKITGDAVIFTDYLKYENDDTGAGNPKDDQFTFLRLGFNFAADIDDDISTFVRLMNDDIVGNQFENMEGGQFGIDVAYVDVKNFFDFGDVRLGRQYVALGHSLVLNDKLDAIAFSKDIDALKLVFLGADQPLAAPAPKNGFGLKALDLKYAFGDHDAEFFYLQNANVQVDPTTWGLSLDGTVTEDITYELEYSKFDPDTAGGVTGTAIMGAVAWDLTDKVGVEVLYGKGDEEWMPTAIHYHRRHKGLFGQMNAGGMNPGMTLATGSLQGVKDIMLKLESELSEKNTGFLVYEKVDANNSDGNTANDNHEYTRLTLGLYHQYAPNTVFGLYYDTVEYDGTGDDPWDAPDAGATVPINDFLNGGGWSCLRVEMSVKF